MLMESFSKVYNTKNILYSLCIYEPPLYKIKMAYHILWFDDACVYNWAPSYKELRKIVVYYLLCTGT